MYKAYNTYIHIMDMCINRICMYVLTITCVEQYYGIGKKKEIER